MNSQQNFQEVRKALEPKAVLITGAARRLGAATARLLHHHGMNIIVHYRESKEAATTLCKELNSLRADSAVALAADLLKTQHISNLVEHALGIWGHLDVVVHNASSFYPTPLESATETQWDDLMGSNLKAPFFLAQAAAPHLAQRKGCIVNIADIYGLRPLADHSIYSSAKAGLIMLTKSLARELAPKVRVNAIAPSAMASHGQGDELAPSLQAKIIKRTPLGRLGEPHDTANAVLFFIEHADFITGQVLAIDGGRSFCN